MCKKNKIITAALDSFFVLRQAGSGKSTVNKEIYHMSKSLGKVVKTNYIVKMCVRKQNYFGCSFRTVSSFWDKLVPVSRQ